MRKNFSRVWLQWDSNLRCRLWKCQVSNAIQGTKPKVRRVFTLRHRATLWFRVNLFDFMKHLIRLKKKYELSERHFRNKPMSTRVYLTGRTVEKRNLSKQKLGYFTVNARVDLASIKRYSCPSLLALGLGIRVDPGGCQQKFLIQFFRYMAL